MWRAIVCVVAIPIATSAGPTNYGWLPATELAPAGKVELDGWIYERDDRGDTHERATVLGGAAVFATEHLELRLPFELTARSAVDTQTGFFLSRFGAEGRYRITARDAALAPMVRLAAMRDVTIRTMFRGELEAAVAYEHNIVHVEASGALIAELNLGGKHFELHPGVGASVRVYEKLRIGAELYAEVSLDSIATTWVALGPNVAWRLGDSWLSATFGIGIADINFAPRLNWGLTW